MSEALKNNFKIKHGHLVNDKETPIFPREAGSAPPWGAPAGQWGERTSSRGRRPVGRTNLSKDRSTEGAKPKAGKKAHSQAPVRNQ